jgi:hypothetical protein
MACIAFDPMDMAHILKAMVEMRLSDRMAMGCCFRKLACEWFGLQRFATDF